VGVVVEMRPTKVWVESDMMGARHVVLHHEGHGEPFTYASFNYNYAYTSNSVTWYAANRLAIELGATEPVDQRQRVLQWPKAEEQEAISRSKRILDVHDRPGVMKASLMRHYFESAVAQTASLASRLQLDRVTVAGEFQEYVRPETQSAWVGFALGMRCAERLQAALDSQSPGADQAT
jgi:hypothetical protein